MLPWTAIYAAGLGKLKLNSALGQPLNAEIDIVTTNNDEVSSLKANIASREAFAQAGINYESYFSTFRISIESRINSNPYIKLTSPQAVNDPFLNILVELNWDSGRILREYAVLLDPVEMNAQSQSVVVPIVSPAPATTAANKSPERISDVKENRQGKNSSKSINLSNQVRDTYGPVIRGDTLSSIARRVLPAGVDLNQMLVALYHANRDAFIANNMNLLKVGAVLKIPEKSEITAIDVSTARNEIRMQAEDWHRYQSKVTAISGESSTAHLRQSDEGKITTSINKNSVSVSAHESPKEVLRLSSGIQLTVKDGQIPEPALADHLRMMEEDAIARNLALKEANERVAMLEKSIENLKQLLELKDSVLAQAQMKAGFAPEIEAQLIETINSSLSGEDSKSDMSSLQTQEQKTLIVQSPTETPIKDAVTKPLLVQETENRSFIDQIFGNIEYIGTASILILLVLLLILKKRRNQSKGDSELSESDSDFSSAMQTRMASLVAAQTIPATETSHLFSENEKDDLTYENSNSYQENEKYDEEFGRSSTYYEKDINQLNRSESGTRSASALANKNEEVRMNDLQSNNQARDLNFESDLEENRNRSADSRKSSDSEEFLSQIDFDLTDDANETKQNLAREKFIATDHGDVKNEIELSDNPANLQTAIYVPDYTLEVDLDSKHSVNPTNSEGVRVEKDNSIEFELADLSIDLAEGEVSNKIVIPTINAESKSVNNDFSAPELVDEALDFDQQQGLGDDIMKSESVSDVPELGLADINLNIEDIDSAEKKDEASDLDEKSEQWQEVETKLDLAKAYQEMDDKEGAKEMLEEVIRDGDAKQKEVARKLLKGLEG
ncbi:FimV/HubP family polar landmark protein [Nitrosomonas sp. Nm166]|uniref:FimV/HubP family polar landmark protein n=1 Tax=Nitrosomonas sp. Nm166 TaxID=1881054 RepID=UPI00210DBA61|nr:FimV/HubP family polar landmark protein [Nitrosomonas sp. Nm166]